MVRKDLGLEEAIQTVEKAGYKVVSDPYEKKTFEVRRDVLKGFLEAVGRSNKKIKDAVTESFELWIKKNK